MDLIIRKANLHADNSEIIDFWHKNHGAIQTDRYTWMYLENTIGQPSCLLLYTSTGKLVGTNGIFIRYFKIEQETISAAQAIDLVIDREYRTAGPAIKLQRNLLEYVESTNTIKIIYGFPLKAAHLVLQRVGYKILSDFERVTKILHSKNELSPYISNSKILNLISAATDFSLKLISGELFYISSSNLIINTDDLIDHRFDNLWQMASINFCIIGERNSEFLSWRYKNSSNKTYHVFTISNKSGSLLAYIIYFYDQKVVKISDMLFVDNRALKLVLYEFFKQMRSENMNQITFLFIGSQKLSKQLKKSGFFKRPEESKIFYYLFNNNALCNYIQNSNSWYLTGADIDL